MKKITSKESARLIASLAAEKKAEDIVLLDMRKVSAICDWFVIVSANSSRNLTAISNFIKERMSKKGRHPINSDGRRNPYWVLLDYADVVIHVFFKDVREFYALERLWSEAPTEKFDDKCLVKTSQN